MPVTQSFAARLSVALCLFWMIMPAISGAAQEPADPTAGMFQRQGDSTELLPANKTGIITLRMDAIAKHPQFAAKANEFDAILSVIVRDILGTENQPNCFAKDIKTVTHQVLFDNEAGDAFQPFGACVVQLNTALDLQWIKKNCIPAEVQQIDSREVIAVASDIEPIRFAMKDDQTLLISNVQFMETDDPPEANQMKTLLAYQRRPNESSWATAFRYVDGGAITFAMPTNTIDPDLFQGFQTGPQRAIRRIFQYAETLACSVDWNGKGMLGVRICLVVKKPGMSRVLANDVQSVCRYVRPLIDDKNEELYLFTRPFTLGLLDSLSIQQVDQPDGTALIDMRATAPWSLSDVLSAVQ